MHQFTSVQQQALHVHPDVPASAYRVAEEVAQDHDEKQASAVRHRASQAHEVAQSTRRAVREIFGDQKYAEYRHFLRSERLDARARLLPPEGPTLDTRVVARERKERANAFLHKLGVEPGRLAALLEAGRTKLEGERELLYEGVSKVYPRDKFLELFGELGRRAPDPHAPTVRNAPYAGWQVGFNAWGNLRWGKQDFVDATAGLVGHDVTLDDDDAGDWDLGGVVADAQVVFWFKPPATGLVEVVLEVQAMQVLHHLCTEDEWGWSDSATVHFNYLMMHVLHPNVSGPSLALSSRFDWETDDTQCVDRQTIPSGSRFFTRLVSDGAVPANQWVAIRAGTRTDTRVRTNDVEIHSLARFQYLVRSVALRILP